jgi:hypothetical protein
MIAIETTTSEELHSQIKTRFKIEGKYIKGDKHVS